MARVGFIGLGYMGAGMARRLVSQANRQLIVWNRTKAKCEELQKEFPDGTVVIADTPKDVVATADVTYTMLSTPEVDKQVFYADKTGAIHGVSKSKSIIDCATLTVDAMQKLQTDINAKGGRFLEAPVSGSKGPAENGTLIFMCAGDKALYDQLENDWAAMGKSSHFLGAVGKATEMKLLVNMVMISLTTCFGEGLALAEKVGLDPSDLLSILNNGAVQNPVFKGKGPNMIKGEFPTAFPLKHAQKDIQFACDMAEKAGLPVKVSATANELMKQAMKEHADDDFTAVYTACKNPEQ
eukprot:m.62336 g.62336  ORF g.62336 m.62336 type:complete len:296 (-) comp19355_c0_seq5:64-951(-)